MRLQKGKEITVPAFHCRQWAFKMPASSTRPNTSYVMSENINSTLVVLVNFARAVAEIALIFYSSAYKAIVKYWSA